MTVRDVARDWWTPREEHTAPHGGVAWNADLAGHYTREFKLEAVRLAAVDGRPKAQIARQLGIRVNQLRKWRQEFERENARPHATSPPVATDDVEQLRREIARLRIENEILKKAAIYFARESL